MFSLNAKAQNNRYYIDNTEVKPEELSALAGVRYNVYKKSDIFINANYLHNGNGYSDISHNGAEVKIGYSF